MGIQVLKRARYAEGWRSSAQVAAKVQRTGVIACGGAIDLHKTRIERVAGGLLIQAGQPLLGWIRRRNAGYMRTIFFLQYLPQPR